MFGAITSKPAAIATGELDPALTGKGLVYRSPIVRMRQLLELYICLRPCKAYPGNALNYRDDIDLVVFRENTEDLYAGVEFAEVPESMRGLPGMEKVPKDAALSLKINTRRGCERIVRAAFEFASRHGRQRVTCVHKANVVRVTDGLFLEVARQIAGDYPAITFDDANVDAMCMWLVKNPQDYDVLVAPNLYGDIVSDLSAQLVGGLGFGCSGNIGDRYAVFEPSHGSAPKYAGRYHVNPIATVLAARMMLDWLGEDAKAKAIESAVAETIRKAKVRTKDMGGSATTLDMAEAIAEEL
jgi:3-isopropylmalate dehydrogenase